ncbi:MAG: HAD family hydrolase [Desulfobacteraceae bacterium]|nr:HAD family hydrolase [Desulfobacteraceae bacterium]
MAIKGILFDFDGTLTLPGALDFPAIKKALGCPLDQLILEFIESQPPDQQAGLMEILEEREDIAAQASLPNRGAEKCVYALKKRQIPVGILTRNRLKSVRKSLEKFKKITIDDFDAIVTRELSLPKPHPDGVIKAAGQMGLSPEELLVVGDFRFDVIAGKRAEASTVLLTNGGESVMAPDDPQPDYTISRLEDLPALLSQLT